MATIGLGYLHYKGLAGTPRNITKAMEYFVQAAGKHPNGAVYAGEILMGGNGRTGNSYLDLVEKVSPVKVRHLLFTEWPRFFINFVVNFEFLLLERSCCRFSVLLASISERSSYWNSSLRSHCAARTGWRRLLLFGNK